MPAFTYQPLDTARREIRLINLFPDLVASHPDAKDSEEEGKAETYVSCAITHASLEDNPQYTALSYTWGDPFTWWHAAKDIDANSDTNIYTYKEIVANCPILLNGAACVVTENLEAALRHLRQEGKVATLWVDALCINQNDPEEKTQQVQEMRHIYSKSASVVAWLGRAADQSDIAITMFDQIGQRLLDVNFALKRCAKRTKSEDVIEMHLQEQAGKMHTSVPDFVDDLVGRFVTTEFVQAITSLSYRSYWGRMWVVQEIMLPPNVYFVCGNVSVSYERLIRALEFISAIHILDYGKRSRPKIHNEKPFISESAAKLLEPSVYMRPLDLLCMRKNQKSWTLRKLIQQCEGLIASDYHDEVFALLGVASDSEELGIRPDYRRGWNYVMVDVYRKYIEKGLLDFLSRCSLRFPDRLESALPSWVPRKYPFANSFNEYFHASGPGVNGRPVDWQVSGFSLSCPAVYLGRIEQVGNQSEREDLAGWFRDLEKLYLRRGESDQHTHAGKQNLEPVWRTAVANLQRSECGRYERLASNTVNTIDQSFEKDGFDFFDQESFTQSDYSDVCRFLGNRRPVRTSPHRIGLGLYETKIGDSVYILVGAKVPYILRPSSKQGKQVLVGEAYIHGVMDGEAMDGNPKIETITIY